MPLLGVDDSTSRRRLPPLLPNPGPPRFYPESCSGQLEVGTSQVDAVGRQTNYLIENMAFLVVFISLLLGLLFTLDLRYGPFPGYLLTPVGSTLAFRRRLILTSSPDCFNALWLQ